MVFQSFGRSKDASAPGGAVICFSFFTLVLRVLLPGETRPTWAYPGYYTPALASSILSMLRPLTRLAVRSARREPGGLSSFSMFHNDHRGMIQVRSLHRQCDIRVGPSNRTRA